MLDQWKSPIFIYLQNIPATVLYMYNNRIFVLRKLCFASTVVWRRGGESYKVICILVIAEPRCVSCALVKWDYVIWRWVLACMHWAMYTTYVHAVVLAYMCIQEHQTMNCERIRTERQCTPENSPSFYALTSQITQTGNERQQLTGSEWVDSLLPQNMSYIQTSAGIL